MSGFLAADPAKKVDCPCTASSGAVVTGDVLDAGRLDGLRTMAGDLWPEILSQVQADLHTAASALAMPEAGQNAAIVRAQTHVLMAVAGTVGGLRVQAGAEALNERAHEDRTDLADPVAELRCEIALLLDALAVVGRDGDAASSPGDIA